MSTSLTSRLKALAEFDNKVSGDRAAKHWKVYRYEQTVDIADHFDFGAKWENARLKPLLSALIECVEALEQAIEVSAKHRKAGMDLFSLNGMTGREALTKLHELVSDEQKGGG